MFLRATLAAFFLLAGAAQAQSLDQTPSLRDPDVFPIYQRMDAAVGALDVSAGSAAFVDVLNTVLYKSNSGLYVRDPNGVAYALQQDFAAVYEVGVHGDFTVAIDWFSARDVSLPSDEYSCERRLTRFGDRATSRSFGVSNWTGTPPTRTCEIKSDDGATFRWMTESVQPYGDGALIVRIGFSSPDAAQRDAVADRLADMTGRIYPAVRTPRRQG